MNRLIIPVFCLIIAAFAFACGGETADLNFKNSYGTDVSEIKWKDSSGEANQTWSGTLTNGNTNEFKEVSAMYGEAEGIDGGQLSQLQWEPGTGLTAFKELSEGSSETFEFTATATK